jgi:hypothetical protein
MKAVIAFAVIAVIAAGAAGYFGWQKDRELRAANAELARVRTALDKSAADLRASQEALAVLGRELESQKVAIEQLRGEVVAARIFLEAEKAIGVRLRLELDTAKQLLAMSRGRGLPAAQTFAPPMLVRDPQPMVIRAGPAGSAFGNAQPAR